MRFEAWNVRSLFTAGLSKSVGGRIILNWIWYKQDVEMCTGFNWLAVVFYGMLL
jgi:hypothetical protein